MSRNPSGVYSLPGGSVITNGDASDASDLNTPLADIAADLNVARPVVAGGTGGTTPTAARSNLGLGDASTKGATGSDTDAVTGTAGADGNLVKWNADGDAVDAGFAAAEAVTLTATQTLTNKTLTTPTLNTPTLNAPVINTSVSGTAIASTAEAEAGALDTKLMTPLRVAEAIDAAKIETFTSTAQSYTAGATITLAHGLSAIPTKFKTWLVCTSADKGFSVGDIVSGEPFLSVGNYYMFWCHADSTNVYATCGNAGAAWVTASGTGTGTFNPASWDVYVEAQV